MDEVLGPPPVRRGAWPEPRLVADNVIGIGVAAKTFPDPVLELAAWLLHEVEGVFLPWDILAPRGLARGQAQGGRPAERAPHRTRPGWAAR